MGCPSPLIWTSFSSRIRGNDRDHCRDHTSQRGTDRDLAGRGQQGLLRHRPPSSSHALLTCCPLPQGGPSTWPEPDEACPDSASGQHRQPSRAGVKQDWSNRASVLGAGPWVRSETRAGPPWLEHGVCTRARAHKGPGSSREHVHTQRGSAVTLGSKSSKGRARPPRDTHPRGDAARGEDGGSALIET